MIGTLPAADILSATTEAFDRAPRPTFATYLLIADRLCRAWCCNRVRMPMNKLPRAALKAKDTGHTHGY